MATMDNVKAALAGESQANRKYLSFSEKAVQDGFPMIARLFRAASDAEALHARSLLAVMGASRSTAENLAGSVEGPARVTGGVIVLPTTSGLQGLALDTGVDRWIEEAWAGAQAWSHSSGVAVTQGDKIAQVSSDGLVSSQTSLVEPDGEPVTEVQVVGFSGQASLLTSRGALLPWPGIE